MENAHLPILCILEFPVFSGIVFPHKTEQTPGFPHLLPSPSGHQGFVIEGSDLIEIRQVLSHIPARGAHQQGDVRPRTRISEQPKSGRRKQQISASRDLDAKQSLHLLTLMGQLGYRQSLPWL
jgi:hypothetical protein